MMKIKIAFNSHDNNSLVENKGMIKNDYSQAQIELVLDIWARLFESKIKKSMEFLISHV